MKRVYTLQAIYDSVTNTLSVEIPAQEKRWKLLAVYFDASLSFTSQNVFGQAISGGVAKMWNILRTINGSCKVSFLQRVQVPNEIGGSTVYVINSLPEMIYEPEDRLSFGVDNSNINDVIVEANCVIELQDE